ncbi:MAG TPA: ParB/RepB/Spo0J family partition protein [Sedimentisphaerales bacterium]|nr:ParB/RepB/Spo0J family partition protein [Sedimentisphaerales bacterium]
MAYLQRRLHYLDPKIISFDINNPRGETPNQIITDKAFSRLVNSIKEFGVLEPLIVRKNGKQGKDYILVDGERRLRAAVKVKLEEVPTLIATDEINGRILAYQVHKLRKDWSNITETKSIKIIIEEIKESDPTISDRDLKKKIREITNSSPHEIADIMRLIKYDENIIKMVIEKELPMSYLVQIDSSFVAKIKKYYPEILQKYDEHRIRHVLAEKAAKGLLGSTRYLMDTFKEVFEEKEHHEKIEDLLLDFLRLKSENIKKTYSAFEEIISPTEKSKSKKKTKKAKKTKKKKSTKATRVPDEIDQKTKLRNAEEAIIQGNVFDLLFNYLKGAVIEFQKRTKIKFVGELELQNFIYSVLRALFESTEFEDPTEKICETSNRLDFVLKDHDIIIEVKYVRDKRHAKKISEELSIDYPRYKQSKYGQTIINYIYDPDNHIANHGLFKKQLKKLLPNAHHYIQ